LSDMSATDLSQNLVLWKPTQCWLSTEMQESSTKQWCKKGKRVPQQIPLQSCWVASS